MSAIKRGQFRLDTMRKQPVRIGIRTQAGPFGQPYSDYHVINLVTNERYTLTDYEIGEELTEMEVLAWASRQ